MPRPGCIFVLLALVAARAQSPPPSFDAVSIKRSDRGTRVYNFKPGQFLARGVTLTSLIALAYDLPILNSPRLSGGPGWVRTSRFDVEAKTGLLLGAPPQERAAKMRLMLRTLLADRFNLVLRTETKDLPIYELTVAKGGTTLKPSSLDEQACAKAPMATCHVVSGGPGYGIRSAAVTTEDIARDVSSWADRPIVDKTGLEGLYELNTYIWADSLAIPGPVDSVAALHNATIPSLSAIFERMGLKLSPTRGPIEIYIIDHADRP
jgi:bla regulator protein BlaR1